MLPFEAPALLEAREFRGELDGGLTLPLLVMATDEHDLEFLVVLKVRTPDTLTGHMGASSLASELMCSMLARALGINVPDFWMVSTSREFAETVPDSRVKALLLANLGLNFGSTYHGAYTLWNSEDTSQSEELLQVLEDVLVFDATVINGDRRRGKPNLLWNGETFLAIDHSLALPMPLWDHGADGKGLLFWEANVRDHVAFRALRNRRRQYSKMLTDWDVDAGRCGDLRFLLPPEWERQPGDVDRMLAFLESRGEWKDEISQDLRRILK